MNPLYMGERKLTFCLLQAIYKLFVSIIDYICKYSINVLCEFHLTITLLSGFHIKKSTIDRAIWFGLHLVHFATADLSYASISDERAEPEAWLACADPTHGYR